MDWQTPFVVYRFKQEEGATEVFEVYHASDFKDAKRWVSYIGLPWDVLCKTPLHPKHSKASPAPEYFAHKVQHKAIETNETDWKKYVQENNLAVNFPTEQQTPKA